MRFYSMICLILCIQSCDWIFTDRDYSIRMNNSSIHSIKVLLNDDDNYLAIYPDTLISPFEERAGVEINNGEVLSIAGGTATWEEIYKSKVPNDTLSIFIFHSDTLSKYTWAEIGRDYNVLQRYDLSLQDLKNVNFFLTYPPGINMNGIKMYP